MADFSFLNLRKKVFFLAEQFSTWDLNLLTRDLSSPAMESWNLNHWTPTPHREVPNARLFKLLKIKCKVSFFRELLDRNFISTKISTTDSKKYKVSKRPTFIDTNLLSKSVTPP